MLGQLKHKLLPPKTPIWSIAIYYGDSLLRFAPHERAKNPILTRRDVSDVSAVFVADPFMLKVEDTWYLFFEVMDRDTVKGQIGLATSQNGLTWTYQRIVLKEPFHLSYPYVFEFDGDYYMIPESYQSEINSLVQGVKFSYRVVFF